MPRYRLKFARSDGARFVAHLDIMRAFERAFRRAGIPMSFTEGFNPHPKISFAAPAPVGLTGEAELVDVELCKAVAPGEFANKLNDVLPAGIYVQEVQEVGVKAPALMSLLKSASYRVSMGFLEPVQQDELEKIIESFLALQEINVVRVKKDKRTRVDIREGILRMTGQVAGGRSILLEMHLAAGSSGTVRPEEVVGAFLDSAKYQAHMDTIKIVRTGLYAMEGNRHISLWEH